MSFSREKENDSFCIHVSGPLPRPNTDDVLKEVSLKYVTRYRARRERETLKDDKVDAGALRTGCRLLDVTILTSPFMASYPFKSPAIINDSESRTRNSFKKE